MCGKETSEDSSSFELRMKQKSSHILGMEARVLKKRQEVQNEDNFLIIDDDTSLFDVFTASMNRYKVLAI